MISNFTKVLGITGFTLLAIVLFIIAANGSAHGYEISIYWVYPSLFWILLISANTCGIMLLILNSYGLCRSATWLIGLGMTLLASNIFICLPFFRDYVINGFYDPLNQMGFIKDILTYGVYSTAQYNIDDFYPATHIIIAILSCIANVPTEVIAKIIPALSYDLYIISIYIFSNSFTSDHKKALLITALASLPLLTTSSESFISYIPRLVTFMLLPLILYLFYQARMNNKVPFAFTILFCLTLVVVPFFHPMDGGLLLIGIFLLMEISIRLYRLFPQRNNIVSKLGFHSISRGLINPSILLFVTWFIWFSATYMFILQLYSIFSWLTNDLTMTEGQMYLDWLARANVSIIESMLIFLKIWGHQLLFFLVAGLASLITFWHLLIKRYLPDSNDFIFAVLFAAFSMLTLVSIIAGYSLGHYRFFVYLIFFAVIINGLFIYELIIKFKPKYLLAPLFLILVLFPFILGTFNSYWSPFTFSANQQVTKAGMTGMEWFLGHRDTYLIADELTVTQYSYTNAILGNVARAKNIRTQYQTFATLPVHFGYQNTGTYGTSINSDRYFLSNSLDKIYYSVRIPDFKNSWSWSPADFEALKADPTVKKIFNSGEFEVYYIAMP